MTARARHRPDRDERLAAIARQKAGLHEQLARLAREEAEVLAGTTPESAPVRRATPAVVPPETPVDELAAAKAARALRRGGFALPGKSA